MTLTAWRPQAGPQKTLVDCPVYEVFFGGARGGGKTDGVLGKYGIKERRYRDAFNAIFFRHELPMLDDAIARSQEIYGPLGGQYNEQKKQWRMPNGGRVRFRPLESIKDAQKYQGQNLTDVCIEEVGNFPDQNVIQRLHGAIRSAKGVPTQMILTGNPGGPGQHWIKERYIDPAPTGLTIIKQKLKSGRFKSRIYIPSRIKDNRILLQNDPEYVDGLYLVGSDQLVKAWLEGDFTAVEGAYFDCWSQAVVLRPIELPNHWTRFRSFDWGSAKPFSVGWWAVASEDFNTPQGLVPKNSLVRYREWYGKSGTNKGLKLTAEEVAQGITEREAEQINYSVADPAIFAEDGGPSIAKRMSMEGIHFKAADNKRVSRRGAMGGWDQLRSRLKGIDGRPLIYCFDTCVDSIRTIPSLQHDVLRPEDLDTHSEDHAADEWRYAAMSKPFVTEQAKPQDRMSDYDFGEDETENWRTA